MPAIATVLGVLLVLVALADLYATVLHVGAKPGFLTFYVNRGTWNLLQALAVRGNRTSAPLLLHAGPLVLLVTAFTWVGLLLLGLTLVVWPLLGEGIVASNGATPTGFIAALYYAGFNLTTLGLGDLSPVSSLARLLTVAMAVIGFSVLTLAVTYFMSIYSSLVRRNTLALSLDHRTGRTGSSREYLRRLVSGGNLQQIPAHFEELLIELDNLHESHRFYPILHYFRFAQDRYALARMLFILLDSLTLFRSALDDTSHEDLLDSSSFEALKYSAFSIAQGLGDTFLTQRTLNEATSSPTDIESWRLHFDEVHTMLASQGLEVGPVEEGRNSYQSMRSQWQPWVVAFCLEMAYSPDEIMCVG